MLDDVPVTVPLPEAGGVLGVAGPVREVHATARWLVAQAAVLHSPRDLSIIVLTDAEGRADWEWIRWLPHARPDGREAVALTGSSAADDRARRVSELAGLVQQRQAAGGRARPRQLDLARTAAILVVLDGARRLRALPGMPVVLQDGPAVGVYAICLDAEERLLPEECRVVAGCDPTDPVRMTVRRAFGDRSPTCWPTTSAAVVRAGRPRHDRGPRRQPGGGRQRAADLAAGCSTCSASSRREPERITELWRSSTGAPPRRRSASPRPARSSST